MERANISTITPSPKNFYFSTVEKENIQVITSGCKLLDCVLGGGWPLGRVSNIVGDKSSGKTLLAIEACTNFHLKYPEGIIKYYEAEAAFDTDYARALGMPIDAVEFVGEENTIEELFELLESHVDDPKTKLQPTIYVVDSLDALSDRAELDRDIDQGSFGANKPKKLSETFRRLIAKLEKSKTHVMIVSQVRDNIGAMVGAKYKRSGGRALDFYASQVLWLREKKKIKKTIKNIERTIGIDVEAECKKNKVGLPYRKCEFPIYFGYGVEDISAHIEFLNTVKKLNLANDFLPTPITDVGYTDSRKLNTLLRTIRGKSKEERQEIGRKLQPIITEVWQNIEIEFLPKHSKY